MSTEETTPQVPVGMTWTPQPIEEFEAQFPEAAPAWDNSWLTPDDRKMWRD